MIDEVNFVDVDINKLFNQPLHTDSLGFRGILKTSVVSWGYLPEDVLLMILELLSGKDLANVVKVCSHWRAVADNEELWEKKLKKDFHIQANASLRPGALSWKKEYERLSDNVPCIELDKIEEHVDEVLHVAFSNSGMMFSTCSKDAFVKVYNADWPFNTVFSAHHGGTNMILNWKYTQLSQFSPCDTQLLVSGRSDVSELGGEIVIYNIFAGMFSIQARVRIRPFDVMGAWVNESHILSAIAHQRIRTMQCLTEIKLNKSAQDIENIHQSTVTRAFLFRSNYLVTVSYLLVADLTRTIKSVVKVHSTSDLKSVLHPMHYRHLTNELEMQQTRSFTQINNNSEQICRDCVSKSLSETKAKRIKTNSSVLGDSAACFSFCSKNKPSKDNLDYLDDADPNLLLRSCGVSASDTVSIAEPSGLRLHSSPVSARSDQPIDAPQRRSLFCVLCGKPIQANDGLLHSAEQLDSSSATSPDEEGGNISLPNSYKILLCFTGLYPCIPHQIGVKIIRQQECSEVVEGHLSEQLRSSDCNRPGVDHWDSTIELKGHGIGMTLSPCNRYLYVNVRRWLGGWQPHFFRLNPEPPALSTQVELVVYDLVTLRQISTLRGHYSEKDVFFIHLAANDLYVASGSSDACGHVWDRHYQTKLAVLPHEDVVNCVAVNPRDPSMAVSVSDDKSIKIWRSKAFSRMLKGVRPKARIKVRAHHQHTTKP